MDANWTVVEDAWEGADGGLTYAITGLTNGTEYDVQVRAVDEDDVNGAWSATTSATPEDHGDNRADATSITTDARIWGAIDPTDDEDYFRLQLCQAQPTSGFTPWETSIAWLSCRTATVCP